jgi:hypothetical protein
MKPPALLVLAAVCLAGCGTTSTASNTEPWTEQQVTEAAGLTSDSDGLSWQTPTGCSVAVIMKSQAEVDTYTSAGDSVATNPDGTAGVKFDGDPACGRELTAALSKLAR